MRSASESCHRLMLTKWGGWELGVEGGGSKLYP